MKKLLIIICTTLITHSFNLFSQENKHMKSVKSYLIIILSLLISCGNTVEDIEFLKAISGRYLYNPDEEIEVYYENENIYLNWRGATKIEPLKVGDGVYFIKEMNEKIQFLKNPQNNKYYISKIPKDKSINAGYDFIKLSVNEHIPSYYLKNNDFEKAVKGYKTIKEKDSLSELVKEQHFNRMGYTLLRKEEFEYAINIFKLNVELYPKNSNVYDSLGDALMRNGDTLESVENYKKALAINSENGRARRIIKKFGK